MPTFSRRLSPRLRTAFVAATLSVPAVVFANPPHALNGQLTIATPPDTLRSTLATAVDEVAEEFNFLIRDIARSKLSEATKVCQGYEIDVRDDVVFFQCDDRKPALLPRDGSPFPSTDDNGAPIQGTVQVQENGLVVIWKGETGSRQNTFQKTDSGVTLRVRVSSAQMPKPMEWTVNYRAP